MDSSHSHYFGAGPAALPVEVKRRIQKDVLQYQNTPVSILELSHRSEEFSFVIAEAQKLLRSLYAIPDNYHILFMQGGATAQFDAVPLNLLGSAKHATYLDTGIWSRKAANLASKYTQVNLVPGLVQGDKICCVSSDQWVIDKETAYFHITPNETVDGVALDEVACLNVPVVADMTSCLLMRGIDVSRYAVIYAGAQKTMGIAGITIVIVRDDVLNRVSEQTPDLFRYDLHVKENSIVNTSPVFACYVTKLMLEWVEKSGGIEVMVNEAKTRADLLYQSIDRNPCLSNRVCENNRSQINVVFNSPQQNLISDFLVKAQEHELTGLQGHRLVGGVRASMYNGTPIAAVNKLSELVQQVGE